MAPRKKTTDQAGADTASADVVDVKFKTPAEVIAAGGYIRKQSTRTVRALPGEFPRLTPDDDQVPFWAIIADGLTFRQLNNIPTSGPDATFENQMKAIAPYVYDWNAWGEVEDQPGVWLPVPAPAVGGWEMFLSQTTYVTSFLVACLKLGAALDLPKGAPSMKNTDSGENDDD